MSRSQHVLVVEDDREIRTMVMRFLQKRGYRVTVAEDGRAMDRARETARFDLIVLDIMLPGEDGLSICRRLRAQSSVPVIMLTAAGELTARGVGLEMGADDYIAKPFDPQELLARIRAVLRRTNALPENGAPAAGMLSFEGWRIDPLHRKLLDLTQGRSSLPFDRSVDILVSRIRRKIERSPRDPEFIKTVRSGGYIFTPEVAAP